MATATMNTFYSAFVLVSCIIMPQVRGYTEISISEVKTDSKIESTLDKNISTLFEHYKISHQKRDVSEKHCENGWRSYGEMCYKIEGIEHEERMSWERAEEFCVKEGGHLVVIHTEELNSFLMNLMKESVRKHVWIGLHDRKNEAEYKWADETTMEFQNWARHEPSGKIRQDEDCVEMYYNVYSGDNGKWNDLKCDEHRPFICQRTTEKNDSKSESVSDKTNSTSFERHKISHHNRNAPEIHCESGWHSYGGMCYKIEGIAHDDRMTWENAEEFCAKEGDHLVAIHSKQLNSFLLNLMKESVRKHVWIGLHDRKNEAEYKWTDETTMEFQNWARHEPSGKIRQDEDCVEMYFNTHTGDHGKWNDLKCDERRPFICQKTAGGGTNVPIAAIIGGVIGLILIMLIIVAAFSFKSWKRKGKNPEHLELQPKR